MNETELSPPPASPPAAQGSSWEAFPGVGVGPNNAPAVTAAATHPDRGRLLDHEPEDATPRVHHAARRRGGGVAACGVGAAAGDASDWVPRSPIPRPIRAIRGGVSPRAWRSGA